jgi:uncharacterized membrane protein
MTASKRNKRWFKHATLTIRNRLISGIFVIVPFVVTIAVVVWLFGILKSILAPAVIKVTSLLTTYQIISEVEKKFTQNILYIITFFCLVILIYIIGVVAKFVAGRKLLILSEHIVLRIPLVRTIYTATKQVTTALSLQDNPAFKSVVMVEFPRAGAYALGFLTGQIRDNQGNTFCKIFIPTTPNVTTGFFELIAAKDVQQTNMTVEEAFKMIISGGIVAPEILKTSGPVNPIPNRSQ